MTLYFGSDNSVGASEPIMQAMHEANRADAMASYGNDPYTERATDAINQLFGCKTRVFFLPTGTAANALALAQLTPRWGSIYCTHEAHIAVDEANAVEYATGGARLVTLPSLGGKLEFDTLEQALTETPNHSPHNAKPAMLSLTNLTEGGRVYSPYEIRRLAVVAETHGLRVHMDGARFANAVAATGATPAELTWQSGVHVLTFGASKGGALQAEAVVFFFPSMADEFDQRIKQAGHLVSKSRYMGAQFEAYLKDGHWLELARHANAMGNQLSKGLEQIQGVRLPWQPDANEVFCFLAKPLHERLQAAGAVYYEWPTMALPAALKPTSDEVFVRLVTSWQTKPAQVQKLLSVLGL
jgi:threonine aldolase